MVTIAEQNRLSVELAVVIAGTRDIDAALAAVRWPTDGSLDAVGLLQDLAGSSYRWWRLNIDSGEVELLPRGWRVVLGHAPDRVPEGIGDGMERIVATVLALRPSQTLRPLPISELMGAAKLEGDVGRLALAMVLDASNALRLDGESVRIESWARVPGLLEQAVRAVPHFLHDPGTSSAAAATSLREDADEQPPFEQPAAPLVAAEPTPADARESPRTFVSYSHDSDEHLVRVLELAQQLRRHGVDAWCDRFEPAPRKGWREWMQRKIEESDFILAVCTNTYRLRFENKEERGKGAGTRFEGRLIAQMLVDDDLETEKVIPVFFTGSGPADIPAILRDLTHYSLLVRYEDLLRRLTDQPAVVPAQLGSVPTLPPTDDGSASEEARITGLTPEATYVLQRACEVVLAENSAVAFVDGGEDFLVEATPPLAREPCREAIDLLMEYGYLQGGAVFGAGRKWLAFTVTADGFRVYGAAFVPDFEDRRTRLVKHLIETTRGDDGVFGSTLASNLGESLAFVSLILEDLVELGAVNGRRVNTGDWAVYSPSAKLKVEFR